VEDTSTAKNEKEKADNKADKKKKCKKTKNKRLRLILPRKNKKNPKL
jgi:hypothetical protein